LLNRRGTTWRRLAEADLAEINEARALTLMTAHPTLIRRPVIDTGDSLLIGFDAQRYAAELSKARP
jgi:arsenate reductase